MSDRDIEDELQFSEEITADDATRLLEAAQEVVSFVTGRASKIMPEHVMSAAMTIIETTHAAMLGAALLASHGEEADAEMGPALGRAKQHVGHFCAVFVANGIKLIQSGEMPAEFVPHREGPA